MIEFEIDGKKLEVEQGKMVIEAADAAGIYIPRFCYHRKLSIAANCRMCLVEVEKSAKPLPACATPVTPGMKVLTRSPKALAAQRAVMEFLLVNHPLDCPICDQGGECELQDLSMGYGEGLSRYNQGKRSVKDKNLGPLIASDMTRCIQCTRCVRFGEEIAGLRELGALGRGEHTEIGTYVQRAIKSEISGNIIDLCPVGALTSKPYRFTARSWELTQHPSIAAHDCIGSNIFIHTRSHERSHYRNVMRVVPRDNEAINENWLSDRDRFSYEALNSKERLLKPRIKQNGYWQETDWETVLELIANNLQQIQKQHGNEQIAALSTPNATVEENYLLQKFIRALGSPHIDHRIREQDFADQELLAAYPHLGITLEKIEDLNTVFLIGSDVRREQPLGCHRIRKASLNGAQILCLNPVDYDFNFDTTAKMIVDNHHLPQMLANIVQAVAQQSNKTLPAHVTALVSTKLNAAEQAFAEKILSGERCGIFLGAAALHHPQAATIRMLTDILADLIDAQVGYFTDGANSAGAWLAGAVPHRRPGGQAATTVGLNAKTMFDEALRAYILFGVEPEFDCAFPAKTLAALRQAELVICFTPFRNKMMEEYAHILLPIAPFSETPGSFINVEGRWQDFAAVSLPLEQVKPAWKVLRVLGNLCDLPGFDYETIEDIRQEAAGLIGEHLTPAIGKVREYKPDHLSAATGLMRLAEWPMYRVDNLVRHAKALQATITPAAASIRINSRLAAQLKLTEGMLVNALQQDTSVTLPLVIDERVADNTVLLPAGLNETAGFGSGNDVITLRGA